MHVKDFAVAHPFFFWTGAAVVSLALYFDIKGVGELRKSYAELQKVKRDSKHLDKVLEEMRARDRAVTRELDVMRRHSSLS